LIINSIYKNMNNKVLIFAIILAQLLLFDFNPAEGNVESNGILQTLSDDFRNPPDSARPRSAWLWLNGDISKEGITRDLEEMKDKGMSGPRAWDIGALRNENNFIPIGPPYLESESVEKIKFALAEAKRVGLTLGLYGSSGWNAGGTWITPDWASKTLYISQTEVDGPDTVRMELPFPAVSRNCPKAEDGKPVFYKEVAI
ncbi:glycosyl hydrolase, partial [Bacteroidota bacterium]